MEINNLLREREQLEKEKKEFTDQVANMISEFEEDKLRLQNEKMEFEKEFFIYQKFQENESSKGPKSLVWFNFFFFFVWYFKGDGVISINVGGINFSSLRSTFTRFFFFFLKILKIYSIILYFHP
jgi:hypothetical protein